MNVKVITLIITVVVLLLGGVWWSSSLQEQDSSLISTNGIHWHPELDIYVDGVLQDIPEGIGLVGGHNPVHTHDDVPVVHLEFEGRVTTDDVKLQRFFDAWHKDIYDFGAHVTMTVNGVENTELGEYEMKDGDKIALYYESSTEIVQ